MWPIFFFHFDCAGTSIAIFIKTHWRRRHHFLCRHWAASQKMAETKGLCTHYQEKMFSLFNQCSASLQSRKHFPGTLQTLGYLLHAHGKKKNNKFTKCFAPSAYSKRDILFSRCTFARTVEYAEKETVSRELHEADAVRSSIKGRLFDCDYTR